MPYTIVIRNQQAKPYCVVKMPEGKKDPEVVKCHATKEQAQKHLQALRINVEAKERGD